MKILLMLSVLFIPFKTAKATELNLCSGVSCEKMQIIFPEEKGKGLLDFDDSSGKLAPADNKVWNEVPYKGAPKRGLDLRWRDLHEGLCLIDPTSKAPNYYKIMRLQRDARNELIYYVVERENHQNTLKANYLFFNSSDSGAFRKLRRVSCSQTPHLYNSSYISKCLEGAQTGSHLCNFDSFVRP